MKPDSLTGEDVDEGSLGLVHEAHLGGIGRSSHFNGNCNPEATFFVTCHFASHDFPGSRVLMVAQLAALAEPGISNGEGQCRIATSTGQIPSAVRVVGKGGHTERVTLTGIAANSGAAPVDYGIECNEVSGAIEYRDMTLSVVALSRE